MNLKKYDVWLVWIVIRRCNLDCAYCFKGSKIKTAKIPSINISKLMNTLEQTGKIFNITFSGGGEPFLVPNMVEACEAITKKHFVSFNTNLTSAKVKYFAENIPPEKVTWIHASLHLKELERLNLIDSFAENFRILKEKGFSILASEIAYPPLITEIKKYKKLLNEKGVDFIFDPFIGEYAGKKYPEAYTKEELKLFDIKSELNKFNQQGRLCNAGYNVATVQDSGDIFPCQQWLENIGNVYSEIQFKNKLVKCPFKFCGCPVNEFNKDLLNKAVEEAGTGQSLILKFFNYFKSIK